jgi:hypothetical protein
MTAIGMLPLIVQYIGSVTAVQGEPNQSVGVVLQLTGTDSYNCLQPRDTFAHLLQSLMGRPALQRDSGSSGRASAGQPPSPLASSLVNRPRTGVISHLIPSDPLCLLSMEVCTMFPL